MGGNLFGRVTAWTLLCVMWTSRADDDLLKDLGLNSLPDVSKINISHTEYTRMMEVYLKSVEKSADAQSIPKLLTFESDLRTLRRRGSTSTRLIFPINSTSSEVQHSELRILAPPIPNTSSVRLLVYIFEGRRRRLSFEQRIFLSPSSAKWSELDITGVMQSWLDGEMKPAMELECVGCGFDWAPLKAAATAVVAERGRTRRATSNTRSKTDCRSSKKRRCCRHSMTVAFKDLDILSEYILQPKSYEAGFCRGRCPWDYNHATNHSRIQSLVHRKDKKAMPKVCCAPSKLEPLEILRINPDDPNKLLIQKWDNMRVLECACS